MSAETDRIADELTRHSDVQLLFPDLFEDLDEEDAWHVKQASAITIHAGWVPTRDEVADLIQHHLRDRT